MNRTVLYSIDKKCGWGVLGQTESRMMKLIGWCLTLFSLLFHLYRGGQCTSSCLPGILFTSTLLKILSNPLAAFQHNHGQDNGQW